MYGKSHNAESKAKIRKSKLGKYTGSKSPMYNPTIYNFIHPQHGKRSCTMYDLRVEFDDLGHNGLSLICNNKQSHHKQWKVINDEQK